MINLSESQVKESLDLDSLLPVLREALIEFSAGRVTQPVRSIVPVEAYRGFLGLMPAVYGDVFGAKLVNVFPENCKRALPTHMATILLFRSETGELLAMMDGTYITAWRTAAVSALAADSLAHPESPHLAILGSGVQARTHLAMLRQVRRFSSVRIWSRNRVNAQQFAAESDVISTDIEDAVRNADVVVTATNASEPLFPSEWLKPTAYVNAIGAVGPLHRELADGVLQDATVIVESREAALRESAEIIRSGVPIFAELGEILAGTRQTPTNRRVVYKSLGIGVEDIAVAKMVYLAAAGLKSL